MNHKQAIKMLEMMKLPLKTRGDMQTFLNARNDALDFAIKCTKKCLVNDLLREGKEEW